MLKVKCISVLYMFCCFCAEHFLYDVTSCGQDAHKNVPRSPRKMSAIFVRFLTKIVNGRRLRSHEILYREEGSDYKFFWHTPVLVTVGQQYGALYMETKPADASVASVLLVLIIRNYVLVSVP